MFCSCVCMSHHLLDTVFYNTPGAANPLSAPSPPGTPLPGKPALLRTGAAGWGRHAGPGALGKPAFPSACRASPCPRHGRGGPDLPGALRGGGGGEGWKEPAPSRSPSSPGRSPSVEETPGGSGCGTHSGLEDTAAPSAHAQRLTRAWPPANKCGLSLGGKTWTSWGPLFWIGKHFRSCLERTWFWGCRRQSPPRFRDGSRVLPERGQWPAGPCRRRTDRSFNWK